MSKFNLTREVTYIEYYKDVEADTLEEAKDKVRNDLVYTYEDLLEVKSPKAEEVNDEQ